MIAPHPMALHVGSYDVLHHGVGIGLSIDQFLKKLVEVLLLVNTVQDAFQESGLEQFQKVFLGPQSVFALNAFRFHETLVVLGYAVDQFENTFSKNRFRFEYGGDPSVLMRRGHLHHSA